MSDRRIIEGVVIGKCLVPLAECRVYSWTIHLSDSSSSSVLARCYSATDSLKNAQGRAKDLPNSILFHCKEVRDGR